MLCSLHSVLALLSLGTENESSSKQELNRALGLTANPNLLQVPYICVKPTNL